MNNLKETFLKKYGVWEYILFVLGAILLGYQTYKYVTDSLEGSALDGIVFVCAVFMLAAPLTLLDAARKKVGIKTRESKIEEE